MIRFVRALLPPELRSEGVMAANRLVAGVVVLGATANWPGLRFQYWDVAIVLWLLLAATLPIAMMLRPRRSPARLFLAMVLDVAGTSIELHWGESGTAFLFPVYLWIILGNGFRFGGGYVLASTVLSLAGFGAVFATTSFWQHWPSLSWGLLAGLVVLPGYAYLLVRNLAQARRAAEAANQAKTMFLASVSHELRTPLNAISGFAELLRGTRLDREQAGMVATIETSADALLAQIGGLLEFSRIEAGGLALAEADFSVPELVAEVERMILPGARAKGLDVRASVTPGTPVRLHGDRRRLRQVLLNLCSNAVKFTERGSISVVVDAGPDSSGGVRLRAEVSDTGIGIPTEAQHRIFEAFSQADARIQDTYGGTGLGLAICERLVSSMGGRIGVESLPGQGSTFWFAVTLPPASADLAGAAPEATPATQHAMPARRRLRVLVADDSSVNRAVVQGMLEGAGHQVVFATNGEEAVAALLDDPPDVALMDINMPGLSGIEAAQHYAFSFVSGRRTPILGITADGTPQTAQRCLDAGMSACLVKPVRMAALLDAVYAAAGPGPADAPTSADAGTTAGVAPAMPAAAVKATAVKTEVGNREDPLDPRLLDDLAALGGAGFVIEVTHAFAREAETLIADLVAALDNGDVQGVRFLSHALASTAANVGARSLRMLCGPWEMLSEAEIVATGAELTQQLRREWRRTDDALRKRILAPCPPPAADRAPSDAAGSMANGLGTPIRRPPQTVA